MLDVLVRRLGTMMARSGILCPSARSAGPVGGWLSGCPPTGHPETAFTWIKPERKRPPPTDGGLDHCGGANCYSAAILSACAVQSMM